MNKKKVIRFKSPIAKYITSYLRERAIMGFKDDGQGMFYTLVHFDQYLLDIKQSTVHLTKEVWDGWFSSLTGLKEKNLYKKYCTATRFAAYLCTMGVESYIPRIPKLRPNRFAPHIFSHEEISNIFSACDRLRLEKKYSSSILIAMPALLRLLYSTGIRIGEALSVKNRDVDFHRHVIRLNKTKNGKERLAPINASLETILREYIDYRDRIRQEHITLPDSPLFVSSIGKSFSQDPVRKWFKIAMEHAGIICIGTAAAYRVHDLRHTACVHAMMKLGNEGLDLYANLPALSVFMGHKSVISTEYYLRLTQEMYPDIMTADMSTTSEILKILSNSIKHGYDSE